VKEATHKKTNTTWFHLYKPPRIAKFLETENRLEDTKSWRDEKLLLNDYKVSAWDDRSSGNG